MPHTTIPRHPDYVEHTRRAHARARVRLHEIRELRALELAVHATDDTVARLLEARAYQAYLDAHAIATEHELDPIIHTN